MLLIATDRQALNTNPDAPRRSEVADVPRRDRRVVRLSLNSVLFAAAAFYVGYCAPIGAPAGNTALAALLGIAAAACAVLAVRTTSLKLRKATLSDGHR
jgi:hypothetical protein